MNRRESLKKIIVATGGLVVLPTWARAWHVGDMHSHPSSFSIEQQDVLASVADTIIPAGDSIGALSVGVDKFLQRLIDNCYEKAVQDNVKTQLAALETAAQNTYQKPFVGCDQLQRQTLLEKLATSQDKPEQDFFKLIKSETIRGFNTSREVMVNYLHYKLVPGHYFGCVDIKA